MQHDEDENDDDDVADDDDLAVEVLPHSHQLLCVTKAMSGASPSPLTPVQCNALLCTIIHCALMHCEEQKCILLYYDAQCCFARIPQFCATLHCVGLCPCRSQLPGLPEISVTRSCGLRGGDPGWTQAGEVCRGVAGFKTHKG